MSGNTEYLDKIGFTDLVVDKLKPEQLVELSDYIEKADKLIDQISEKSKPYDEALARWFEEGVGGDGIYNYADMFGSYRDLYNLLEKAKATDPKFGPGLELHQIIRRVYEMLTVPTLKEVFAKRNKPYG